MGDSVSTCIEIQEGQVWLTRLDGEAEVERFRLARPIADQMMTPERIEDRLPDLLVKMEAEFTTSTHSARRNTLWITSAGFNRWTKKAHGRALAGWCDAAPESQRRVAGAGNDAVVILLADDSADGVLIASVGSAVAAYSSSDPNRLIRRSGEQWLLSDYGSLSWIGLSALRIAYSEIEQHFDHADRGQVLDSERFVLFEKSTLVDLTMSEFDSDANRIGRFLKGVHEASASTPKARMADLGERVAHSAAQGDPACREIVFDAAQQIARSTSSALQGIEAPEILVCGRLSANTAYSTALEECLKTHNRRVTLRTVLKANELVTESGFNPEGLGIGTQAGLIVASRLNQIPDVDLNRPDAPFLGSERLFNGRSIRMLSGNQPPVLFAN